jgi:hypothetical protein
MPEIDFKRGQALKYLPKDNRFHGEKIYVKEPHVYNDQYGKWIFVTVGKVGVTAIAYLTDIEEI